MEYNSNQFLLAIVGERIFLDAASVIWNQDSDALVDFQ
jgi:hypothetical protein